MNKIKLLKLAGIKDKTITHYSHDPEGDIASSLSGLHFNDPNE